MALAYFSFSNNATCNAPISSSALFITSIPTPHNGPVPRLALRPAPHHEPCWRHCNCRPAAAAGEPSSPRLEQGTSPVSAKNDCRRHPVSAFCLAESRPQSPTGCNLACSARLPITTISTHGRPCHVLPLLSVPAGNYFLSGCSSSFPSITQYILPLASGKQSWTSLSPCT